MLQPGTVRHQEESKQLAKITKEKSVGRKRTSLQLICIK
jgi:hypothetical protein